MRMRGHRSAEHLWTLGGLATRLADLHTERWKNGSGIAGPPLAFRRKMPVAAQKKRRRSLSKGGLTGCVNLFLLSHTLAQACTDLFLHSDGVSQACSKLFLSKNCLLQACADLFLFMNNMPQACTDLFLHSDGMSQACSKLFLSKNYPPQACAKQILFPDINYHIGF